MKKGIGPQGLGASKSPAKMYGAKSPAKQTNEFGEKGQFNPYTKDSKSMGDSIERILEMLAKQNMTKSIRMCMLKTPAAI